MDADHNHCLAVDRRASTLKGMYPSRTKLFRSPAFLTNVLQAMRNHLSDIFEGGGNVGFLHLWIFNKDIGHNLENIWRYVVAAAKLLVETLIRMKMCWKKKLAKRKYSSTSLNARTCSDSKCLDNAASFSHTWLTHSKGYLKRQ